MFCWYFYYENDYEEGFEKYFLSWEIFKNNKIGKNEEVEKMDLRIFESSVSGLWENVVFVLLEKIWRIFFIEGLRLYKIFVRFI